MKKYVKSFVLFFVALVCFFACGCDQSDLPQNLISTKSTNMSPWEYYYQVDNLQDDIFDDGLDCAKKSSDNLSDVQNYISILTNNQNITDVLRDCVATIDCFEQRDTSAIFDFENLKNYKIELLSGSTYRVTYDQIFVRCVSKNANQEVDEFVFEVPISVCTDITLSKGENNVYLISSVVKKCTLSGNASGFEQEKTENGKKITNKRTVEASTDPYTVLLTASQIVKFGNVVEKAYEHESKYYMKNGHFYLQDTVKIDGTTSLQQNIRMDNSFSNISIVYNKNIGYMSYDLQCHLEGQLSATGEIYFQGNNKYVEKRVVSVTPTSDGKPLGLGQSFVLETKLQSENASQKLVFGKIVETKLANQDMNTFAVHTVTDGKSAVLTYENNAPSLNFYG